MTVAMRASDRSPIRLGPSALLAIIGAGGVAVLALWWNDTSSVDGLAGWLTNAGRITGLLAGYAIVVLLALMSRTPVLERGLGADRLARWHSMGGRYVVSLAVAHTVLIIWGYAVAAHTNVVHQTTTLVLTYPDALMATVAVGLLVAVGIVSARAARQRMRYETWHFIHLYTYLAVALSFAHAFANGADFTDPKARWLWSIMYLTVGVLLLWFRLLTPVFGAFYHGLRVAEVRSESADVFSVYVVGRRLNELAAAPGQFFRWRFAAPGLWWAANPYSLSAPPSENLLRITVKSAGAHSAALRALHPGTRVYAEGPYGAFTDERRRERQVLLIGAGVGITPVRAMFESMPAGPGDITLIYRASSAADVVLGAELDAIGRARRATVHYVLGPRQDGRADPMSAAALARMVPGIGQHDVFICGPAGFTEGVRRSLRQAGVPRRRIHRESFEF